jgi:hypothetical protein
MLACKHGMRILGRADVKALPIVILFTPTYALLSLFPGTVKLKYSFCVIILQ